MGIRDKRVRSGALGLGPGKLASACSLLDPPSRHRLRPRLGLRDVERVEAVRGLVAQVAHELVERERADAADAVERANARADATRARSVEELERWGSLADEYASRLEEMQGELDAAAHEGAALRAHNAALGAHNEQLRAHAEQLRAMLEKERAERAA